MGSLLSSFERTISSEKDSLIRSIRIGQELVSYGHLSTSSVDSHRETKINLFRGASADHLQSAQNFLRSEKRLTISRVAISLPASKCL